MNLPYISVYHDEVAAHIRKLKEIAAQIEAHLAEVQSIL